MILPLFVLLFPLSFSLPSMLFCVFTFAFEKKKLQCNANPQLPVTLCPIKSIPNNVVAMAKSLQYHAYAHHMYKCTVQHGDVDKHQSVTNE